VRWLKDIEKDLQEMAVKRWLQEAVNTAEWACVIQEAKSLRGP
jgi:hypothetical protein